MNKNVISLFSGCGGLDLGFINAGFNIIWANDISEDATLTYKHNIGNHIINDSIYNINTNNVPNADILIGGFPCLGFTLAQGKGRKVDCEYNYLYKEYERFLIDKQPKYFIVENVIGIKSGEEFSDFFHNKILKSFENAGLGYKVKYKELIAADYGVPQKRKRVIILGTRKDIEKEPNFPEAVLKKENYKTLKDAIYDLPRDYSNEFYNHTGTKHMVKINQFVGNRALNWNLPSPTITGRGSRKGGAVIHPHPDLHRRLSIRECARIQSFPDNFMFLGSNSSCYAQIGNAVPPLMSYYIALEILKVLN